MSLNKPKYRQLTSVEIKQLEEQGCSCSEWSNIKVVNNFSAINIHSVKFSGEIKLGAYIRAFELPGGVRKMSGISNCTLHNVSIGDNVYIDKISGYIANYEIDDDTFIESVHIITTPAKSAFGNGVEISVINEAGGREVTIFDNLSSHLAYIVAAHRYRVELASSTKKLIARYVARQMSDIGHIGRAVTIQNCGSITAVKIGDLTTIDGAARLTNGSINSTAESPIYIGSGVICRDFIISSGSIIDSGSILNRCFVGQSVSISNKFYATESLFFANSHCEQGEASSIFAGPFTVTHHKSTLLIAGMFSFMNAGSGSNQSNHTYRLGPVHQGILERGAKTASGSYILWPAKIGAFSIVSGSHKSNPDTSNLPFSYLIEVDGGSMIVPGVNLKSAGTLRDTTKWIERDKRKESDRRDIINSSPFTPYTIQKIIKGVVILKDLIHRRESQKMENGREVLPYNRVFIEYRAALKGIKYYELALNRYFGEIIAKNRDGNGLLIKPNTTIGLGEWGDICGLIAPLSEIRELEESIEKGKIVSIEETNQIFSDIGANYSNYEWSWAYDKIKTIFDIEPDSITSDEVSKLITTGKNSSEILLSLIGENAAKEYSSAAMIGFGLDDDSSADRDESIQALDFRQVRGSLI